jgi:adenosylhomocysteine nucleosidase
MDFAGSWVNIVFALPEEARPLLRRLPPAGRPGAPEPGLLYRSEALRLTVYRSGAGAKAAAKIVAALPNREPSPQVLIVCGFSGGLRADLPVGALAVAEQVLDARGETLTADPRLLAALGSVRIPLTIRRGTIATVDRVLGRADEKRELGARTGAIAVDMESAGAARAAIERGIPWLAIRTISDGLEDSLPFDFNVLADADGNVAYRRVILAALAHPAKIPGLMRLGQRSALAANQLALLLSAFTLPDDRQQRARPRRGRTV